MEQKNLKKFKLNNSVLKDFDSLMSMHLDKVEELTVSEIDNKSKLLNIIGLCINIKTLIIEGDEKINTNSVILNICKPEILDTLILNNVKLPTGKAISRLNDIKLLSINNVRYSNVSSFLKSLENPDSLDGINIANSDFGNESISIMSRFTRLKYLNVIDVKNCTFDKLDFLLRNRRLEKVNFKGGIIKPKEANKLLRGGFEKNVSLKLETANKTGITDYFEVKENVSTITINTVNLEEIVNSIQACKVDNLVLIMDEVNNIVENINKIKSIRNNISLAIKDISYITKEEAMIFDDKLCIKYINLLDTWDTENNNKYTYSIQEYIKLREEFDKFIGPIEFLENDVEKFLSLYKKIAEEIKIDDLLQEACSDISNLGNALEERKCYSNGYAEILQNCLSCLNIESKIIKGKYKNNDKEILWNQVKLDDKWYNLDLLSDRKSLSNKSLFKKKTKYCLLSDEKFYLTHIPENQDREISVESYDKKVINLYIRTGKFDNKIFMTYLKYITSKLIKINKYSNIKALPEGNKDEQ